jgi:hypothetical protein
LDGRISDLDGEITEVFRGDERAEVIESLPGMGPIPGAEFLAVVTDLAGYKDSGHLAAHAGLAPLPRARPVTYAARGTTTGGCGGCSTCPRKRRCRGPAAPGSTTARTAPGIGRWFRHTA